MIMLDMLEFTRAMKGFYFASDEGGNKQNGLHKRITITISIRI
jgi:hypothetical protein